ncbi:MAG TPA: PhnD/SsuA/transferrin family substrate-binding protein [Polyangia bacterium]
MLRRILLLALYLSSPAWAAGKAPPVELVIVYPGGPDAGAEGKKLAEQLVQHLAGATGLDPSQFAGAYFNDNQAGAAYLKTHRDAFVLGGLGFFLSQRKALGLAPLASPRSEAGSSERFAVVVKKGRFKSLENLRGKSLWSSVLFEDARYVDRFAFAGKLQSAQWFEPHPTPRPLSAVRKLDSDGADAVLLNQVQLDALKKLPLFEKLEVIHTSDPVPTLGLMVVPTPRTKAVQDKIVKSVLELCATAKGKGVCQGIGILGFDPITVDKLDAAIKKYDDAR